MEEKLLIREVVHFIILRFGILFFVVDKVKCKHFQDSKVGINFEF